MKEIPCLKSNLHNFHILKFLRKYNMKINGKENFFLHLFSLFPPLFIAFKFLEKLPCIPLVFEFFMSTTLFVEHLFCVSCLYYGSFILLLFKGT